MSLDAFYRGLAALVADPELVRRMRRGDHEHLDHAALTARESARLVTIAGDPRMDVMCSLYRSNRLTALVRTVPAVVDALGDRLAGVLGDFWRDHPRTDMQFRSEADAFCEFVRSRFPADEALTALIRAAQRALHERYESTAG